MKALQFKHTGSLDNLELIEVPPPAASEDAVVVQIKAAAINPSDVKNVLGKMHLTTVPRIPGRDFAGIVVAGPSPWSGKSVFGSGGDLGFARDGTHAEFVSVPVTALNPLPQNLSFDQAAAVGVAYLTAWAALITAARLQKDETILITGATGAVGSAAVRIAAKRGARILGTIRTSADITAQADSLVSKWIGLDAGSLPESVARVTNKKGVDVVFDVVGGALFEPCLNSLAWRGRHVAIASNPDPRVFFNLVDFYHRELRLIGVDSLKLSFEETADIFRDLTPGIEDGTFPAPTVQKRSLAEFREAYQAVAEGKVRDKQVFVT